MATKKVRTKNKRSIDRLYEFAVWCKDNGFLKTQSEFEKECGIGSNYLTNTLQSTKGSVGAEIIEKVYRRFPFVDVTWVVTGDGTMLDLEKLQMKVGEKLKTYEDSLAEIQKLAIRTERAKDEIRNTVSDFETMRKRLKMILK